MGGGYCILLSAKIALNAIAIHAFYPEMAEIGAIASLNLPLPYFKLRPNK